MKVRELVLRYYAVLRSILRAKPQQRRCLKRCRHCRIFFFTDPRNGGRRGEFQVGRKDLGCPFGCREAYEKQQSTRRSVAYYKTDKGKKKKQQLNQRRSAAVRAKAALPQAPSQEAAKAVCGPWPEPMVEHVQIVVSWIEDRPVSREEILAMLAKVLRQQGMGRRRKIDHTVSWLNENPP